MMPDDVESVISYRLGEVEKTVKQNELNSQDRDRAIHEKLDKHLEFQREFAILKVQVESLLTSRNRIIAALFVLATGLTMMGLERLFK